MGDLRVSKDPSIKRVDRASNFEPFTPSFGDGEEIPSEAVERMHAAMWGEAVAFDWEVSPLHDSQLDACLPCVCSLAGTGSVTQRRSQVGDVLAVDNEVCMHGRCSFDGSERKMYSSFSRL